MNILITGVHGFVGSNLTKYFKTHEIFGVDIVKTEKEDVIKTFSWHDVDNGNLPEIDVIIHLAGKAHDTKNTTKETVYFDVNVGLTEKIFNYFVKSSATKFIFFSSVAIVESVKGDFLSETDLANAKTSYGKSKLAAEQFLSGEILPEWKKLFILRPCMIHGPGNKGNLNLLYSIVKKRLPWPLGRFDNKKSFLSINNLAYVIDQIITKDIAAGVYQVADDEPLATNDIIRLISQLECRKIKIWNINPFLIKQAAKLGDIFHFPLNSLRLKKLTENFVVSNVKIKSALDIERMPINALDGLKETIEWLKNE